MDSFTEDALISACDWLLLALSFTIGEEGCSGEHPRPSAHARQQMHVLTATKCPEDVLFWVA